MAKAEATCTCKHCGETFTVTKRCSNRREAESWEKWAANHFDICYPCEQQENEEIAKKLSEQAKENGFAVLVGSPKQITWAEQIRASKIKQANQKEAELIKLYYDDEHIKAFRMCIEYILANMNKASYWIDSRDADIESLAEAVYDKVVNTTETEQSAKEEATIVPENATHGTVEIRLHENEITAHYPKDETFRQLVKALGYSWNGSSWNKQINEYTGSITDRVAELANSLLNAGFLVELQDEEAREKAISANFEPECKRWIKYFRDEQMLSIILPDNDRSIYDKARAISKKTRYKTGRVLVPIELYDMVEDFANIYSYKISSTAKREIAKYRELLTRGVSVSQPESIEETDKLKEILKSDDAVLSDLIDD